MYTKNKQLFLSADQIFQKKSLHNFLKITIKKTLSLKEKFIMKQSFSKYLCVVCSKKQVKAHYIHFFFYKVNFFYSNIRQTIFIKKK